MAQYVLKHGGIKTSSGMQWPSIDPDEPTVLELKPDEALKMGGAEVFQLRSEYDAELAGAKAGAKAKAAALKEAEEHAKAEAAKAEAAKKPHGGGK